MDILTVENDMTGRPDPASDAKAAGAAEHYRKPTVEEVFSDDDDDDDDEQQIKRPYRIESPGMWTFRADPSM
jgi:hypothetical protein